MIADNASVVEHRTPYQRIDLGSRTAVVVPMSLLNQDGIAALASINARGYERIWDLVVQAAGGEI